MKILVTDDSTGWVEHHVKNLKKILPQDAQIDIAKSAREGLDKITLNIDEPYDVIFTDMQMENDFLPLYAGEWFVKQIKTYPEYEKTRIVIISAAPNIKRIAERHEVEYLEKFRCQLHESYQKLFENSKN